MLFVVVLEAMVEVEKNLLSGSTCNS